MNRFYLCVSFLVFLFLLFLLPMSVLAQENNSTISAKLKSGGSFELFWPSTAGKTIEDSTYFLKLWKEQIQGILIFDTAQKANYEVKLATKRVLETEKLLKEKKNDLAIQTLEKALANLSSARTKFSESTKSGNDYQSEKINITNQLSNLEVFLPSLSSSDKIQELVKNFLNDLK